MTTTCYDQRQENPKESRHRRDVAGEATERYLEEKRKREIYKQETPLTYGMVLPQKNNKKSQTGGKESSQEQEP